MITVKRYGVSRLAGVIVIICEGRPVVLLAADVRGLVLHVFHVLVQCRYVRTCIGTLDAMSSNCTLIPNLRKLIFTTQLVKTMIRSWHRKMSRKEGSAEIIDVTIILVPGCNKKYSKCTSIGLKASRCNIMKNSGNEIGGEPNALISRSKPHALSNGEDAEEKKIASC